MSRSDTFDSDTLETDKPDITETRSLPWISAPVLQNTTCQVLLDPRKLLCESSSIVALIPCQTFSSKKSSSKTAEGDTQNSCSNSGTENKTDVIDKSEEIPLNVFQSDLLSEILSSANALQLLGSDISSSLSPNESNSSLPLETEKNDSTVTNISTPVIEADLKETENQEALTSWCFEGDDSFKDVIEAINRLCDTMSSSGSNLNDDDSLNFCFPEMSDTQERITEQPKTNMRTANDNQHTLNLGHQSSNLDDSFLDHDSKRMSTKESSKRLDIVPAGLARSNTDSIDSLIYPQTPESLSTPEVTGDEMVNPDSSIADSSSPAVIEDDSSTNQTDILQYSMCSSSLINEDSGLFLLSDNHLPNPEEIPPPGHVAAMRVKFETITNVNTMRLLKRSDDEA